jgi:spermidine synthase
MKLTPAIAFVLIGFAATVGQILVLRELLTVFSGSELAVAVVLAAWLFWTALGALLGGKISQYGFARQSLFGYLQNVSGLTLIATILFIRIARLLFHIGAGELVTLGEMLAISFLTLAPFCLISGCLFSLACALLATLIPHWTRSPGLVYFLEGLGAGIGGLIFTLLLIHHFNAIQIGGSISLLLCISAFVLTRQSSRRPWIYYPVFLFSFLALLIVQQQNLNLERISHQWQWSGFHLIASEETIFGHITVVEKEKQISFFETGLWNFAVPDRLSAEEAVHYAMLQHPEPKSVLLIGGGVSESLGQLLLHPSVRQVDYLELDPRLIELGKAHLPVQVTAALESPRVAVHNEDGRQYLARSSKLYDVILINLPEPFTAQINRFYTAEFFRLAASRMHQGGVFFFTASASETALGPYQAKYLKLLHRTALSVFPEVVIFPGKTARFFCSNSPGTLTSKPETLVERIKQRHLQLLYVQDNYLLWDLSPLQQETFMAMVDQAAEAGINSDLNLKAYAYNLLMLSSHYSQTIGRIFTFFSKRTIWISALLFLLLVSLLSLRQRFSSQLSQPPNIRVLYGVALFGLSGISLEILIILGFQVFFGYLYYKMGLLLALFMVGLAGGSFIFSHYPKSRENKLKTLVTFQSILACFCLALALLFIYFDSLPPLDYEHFFYRESFSLLSLLAGFIGGTHFPLANQLLLKGQSRVGQVAGLIYGVDLLGSFLGGLLVGLVLIPSGGILQTLLILALLNLTAVMPFVISWPADAQLAADRGQQAGNY